MTNKEASEILSKDLGKYVLTEHDVAILTAIDALEERPKGEWIELPKAFDSKELPCKCSICEHILSFINFYPKSNFCPNCGADMRGKEE